MTALLPPPCPNCTGKTALKKMYKLPKDGNFMCFFHCDVCALEYPHAVGAAEVALAGLQVHARTIPDKLTDMDPRE